MRTVDLIEKKKRGGELADNELDFLVTGFTAGEIPDYQMSAFLMAVCFRGMTEAETAHLTLAMLRSGRELELSDLGGVTVDKHSSGGVGDKTTLIVAPAAAALGLRVAKLSGRGLGHTGGTIDKLESIPGFRTEQPAARFREIVREVGCCVAAQSGELAPADKKLYALRDVTGTVESVPLIASSIMSKKLAAGASCIALDVKCGSGAFMKTGAEAGELARAMVRIGAHAGRRTAALVTDMDRPLGRAVGNALEVAEAVEVLRGGGESRLRTLCVELTAELLELAEHMPHREAMERSAAVLQNGAAFGRLCAMVRAQGGDDTVLLDISKLPRAPFSLVVKAPRGGWLSHMDTELCGLAAMRLGAGRAVASASVDPAAGLVLRRLAGERVLAGEPLAELFASREALLAPAAETFLSALSITGDRPPERPLILARFSSERA